MVATPRGSLYSLCRLGSWTQARSITAPSTTRPRSMKRCYSTPESVLQLSSPGRYQHLLIATKQQLLYDLRFPATMSISYCIVRPRMDHVFCTVGSKARVPLTLRAMVALNIEILTRMCISLDLYNSSFVNLTLILFPSFHVQRTEIRTRIYFSPFL